VPTIYRGREDIFWWAVPTLRNFKDFHINKELGILSWQDDVDIAPEALYHAATGEPLPEWMGQQGNMKAV